MKKRILMVLLAIFRISSAMAENYQLDDGITLNEENAKYSILLSTDESVELNSLYDNGVVVRYSDESNNPTGLGKFVEVEYRMGFEFEGTFVEAGVMRMLFSNLEEVFVTGEQDISKGDPMCLSRKGPEGDLRVFILSDTADLQFLEVRTQNRKVELDGLWYWDPSFLFQ